jgi:hypothetical protein
LIITSYFSIYLPSLVVVHNFFPRFQFHSTRKESLRSRSETRLPYITKGAQ